MFLSVLHLRYGYALSFFTLKNKTDDIFPQIWSISSDFVVSFIAPIVNPKFFLKEMERCNRSYHRSCQKTCSTCLRPYQNFECSQPIHTITSLSNRHCPLVLQKPFQYVINCYHAITSRYISNTAYQRIKSQKPLSPSNQGKFSIKPAIFSPLFPTVKIRYTPRSHLIITVITILSPHIPCPSVHYSSARSLSFFARHTPFSTIPPTLTALITFAEVTRPPASKPNISILLKFVVLLTLAIRFSNDFFFFLCDIIFRRHLRTLSPFQSIFKSVLKCLKCQINYQ